MGALTMLNECGDVTLAWSEDQNAAMRDIIQKKMDAGCVFFIIEPRGVRVPLKKADDALEHRALAIPDEHLAAFVSSGAGSLVSTPKKKVVTRRKAKDADDAAKNESVGVMPRKGG